ncbi:MAG: YibE/F family protein [Syntrophomonadaceae bacterium]|jgi:uncharacterized membrane protein|nr:YibE/F family protein [Syntrophomonadaceae bacterium]
MYVRRILLSVLTLLLFLCVSSNQARAEDIVYLGDITLHQQFVKAKILTIEESEPQAYSTWSSSLIEQHIKVKILSGAYNGQELTALNSLSGSKGIDIIVEPGDLVMVCIQEAESNDGNTEIYEIFIADQWRSNAVFWLLFIFAVLMVAIGRLQGLKSLLALCLTALGIYYVLLPGLVAGKSPIFLTVAILVVAAMLTMFFVAGFSRKAAAATLGILGGLLAAAVLSYIFGDLAQLHGLASEEERTILYFDELSIDMEGLLFSGIMIGALGAIMDVAISISSAITEIKQADPGKTAYELFVSGMNVGKDIMGTMANTLILAYAGGALPLLILFIVNDMEAVNILNWELVVTELVRALVGSIALILCVPITAIVAGFLQHNKATAAEE